MYPQVQDFSAGYYLLAPLYVEPHDVSTPRISDRVYQALQANVLNGFERVILKCQTRVFEVEPSRSVSTEVLALPRHYIEEELDISFPPEEVVTYVAKKNVAEDLLGLDRGRELVEFYTWDEP